MACGNTEDANDETGIDGGGAASEGAETGVGETSGAGSSESAGGDGEASDDAATEGGAGGSEIPPTQEAALLQWLQDGEYADWSAESSVHPSTGPHFGGVRVFINAALEASLDADATAHPEGAASVKELFGDGDTVRGWSVILKLDADSEGGDNWYWYERFGDSLYADGAGERLCTGCHSGGVDFFTTPYPLQ